MAERERQEMTYNSKHLYNSKQQQVDVFFIFLFTGSFTVYAHAQWGPQVEVLLL